MPDYWDIHIIIRVDFIGAYFEVHLGLLCLLQYKYQLNIDGTVAAYRFPYLLGGGALVFKQDSNYYEYFYKSLKPNVHYIPFKRDLSDLKEKIQWAKENDDKVSFSFLHHLLINAG